MLLLLRASGLGFVDFTSYHLTNPPPPAAWIL